MFSLQQELMQLMVSSCIVDCGIYYNLSKTSDKFRVVSALDVWGVRLQRFSSGRQFVRMGWNDSWQ